MCLVQRAEGLVHCIWWFQKVAVRGVGTFVLVAATADGKAAAANVSHAQ
jgi:hypothetical protein